MRSQPSSWVRKCQSFLCLPCDTTSTETLAPSTRGAPSLTPAPSPTRRTSRSSLAPTSSSSFSTFSLSPSLTRYCLPPVFTTAYIACSDSFRLELGPVGREIPPPGAERNGRSSGSAPPLSRTGRPQGAFGQLRERLFVRRTSDPTLGDDGIYIARGRHVEGRVEDLHSLGGDALALDVGHLFRCALLDGDVGAGRCARVEGADGRSDEERDAGGTGRERKRIGAHLVGGVAVAGDAICSHHHAADAAARE